MSKLSSFYIGWNPEAPGDYARKVKRFIGLVLALSLLIALTLVLGQRGFDDSVFELGNLTTHEGILVSDPVPMLKVSAGTADDGGTIYRSVLLIGFGKHGAEETLREIEKKNGESAEGRPVRLQGTRIYYDGKEALELTKGADTFIGFGNTPANYQVGKTPIGEVSLSGEILDPKCALGVMKPGYGKPHRSCAVRCLSGGIPPVLRISNEQGENNYCIILGEDGKMVTDQLLKYVADQIRICGRLERQDDWLVIHTNPETDVLRLKPYWMSGEVPMCNTADGGRYRPTENGK